MNIFSVDLYGKETILLAKSPAWWKGIFYTKKWAQDKIDITVKRGEKKYLRVICGEIGDGILLIIDYALRKAFEIVVISGPKPCCKALKYFEHILNGQTPKGDLKFNPGDVELYFAKARPIYHFSLIGEDFLYLENSHEPGEEKTVIGVTNPYFMDFYEKYFEKLKLNSRRIVSRDELDENVACILPEGKKEIDYREYKQRER